MDELNERAFLFGIQVSADAELLGWIARNKINHLSVCSRFKLQRRIMLRSWFFQRSHGCRINIVLIKLQLLCGTNRLSISRITLFTFQGYRLAPMYCDGPLMTGILAVDKHNRDLP